MNPLAFFRRSRPARPAPRHTASALAAAGDAGSHPRPPWAPADRPVIPAPARFDPDAQDLTTWDLAGKGRPYAPEDSGVPAPAAVTPDLTLLPATLLRAIPRDGSDGSAKEVLAGWPVATGQMRATEAGQDVAGLSLGGDADVLVLVENPSVQWWDELISQAMRVRDLQAYGTFRADSQPAAAPVITAGTTEAIAAARETLRRADDAGLSRAAEGTPEFIAISALADALECYDQIRAADERGLFSWHVALRDAARDAAEARGRVADAVRGLYGDRAASYVMGADDDVPDTGAAS